MGPKIDALQFRPDLKHEDLNAFLDRLRPSMPAELWDIVEPYTLLPRAWDAHSYGLADPMDCSTGPWLVEVNAPITWHDKLDALDSVLLTNTRPTTGNLRTAWSMIRDAGSAPTVAVNLGPASASGKWLLEVVAVVASGRMDRATALLIADVLGGHPGMFTLPDSVLWRTCM